MNDPSVFKSKSMGNAHHDEMSGCFMHSNFHGPMGSLPKLHFPRFDGDSPKHWISRSEDYFEMYGVDQSLWIKIASMHITDSAARFQSVEQRVKSMSWQEFCELIMARFGRENLELLIRQLIHAKQTGSVKEYIDRFAALVDQLSAYESQTDPLYYIMKFIDRLKDELKSAIIVQRPPTFDTACVLAQLQEDVTSQVYRKDNRRQVYTAAIKPVFKQAHVLPLPPVKPDKSPLPHTEETKGRSLEEKLAALRAFKRARGLCERCADKWVRGHRCAEKIHLNVLHEVLELFNIQDEETNSVKSHKPSQCNMMLSEEALNGLEGPRTMRFEGSIQDRDIILLVDSGSSHTFISAKLAKSLSGVTLLKAMVSVKVANGEVLTCSSQMLQAMWSIQGVEFIADLSILMIWCWGWTGLRGSVQ